MMGRVISASLKFRLLVVLVAVAVAGLGVAQLRSMPTDVLPEFTPPVVDVQTEALGLSAAEVEQLVTVPLEQNLLNGVPWLAQIRSESVPGLSSVEMVFAPGTDILRARQLVQERLTQVPGVIPNVSRPPVMLQPVSSTSRVMMIGLSSRTVSPIELSVLARWKIRPRLMGVPGVANVAIWGNREQQLQVQVDPRRLQRNGVSLTQVVITTSNALWVSPLSFVQASTPGTGGFVDTPNQRLGIQHISPINTARDLAQVTLEDTGGRTLRLADVADVVQDHQPLIGDAVGGGGASLMLVVEKAPGASTLEVTRGLDEALRQLQPGLAGITVDPRVYRPASAIQTTVRRAGLALLVGLLLAVALLGALAGDWRVALVGLVTIPLSLLSALLVLHQRGATLNGLVLAGLMIALAVVVDDTVVGVDAIRRRLRERADGPAAATVLHACLEVRGPLLYATVIVLLAAVPALLLGGLTGAFLRPLAAAYLLAVVASMVVALVVTPALALALFARAPLRRGEGAPLRWLRGRLAAALGWLLPRPAAAFALAAVLALAGLAVLPQLAGRPLLPTLQDRDLVIHLDAAPGTSQPEMERITARASRELRAIPGVRDVGAHVGRAITSDRVVDVDAGEIWVSIDPAADEARTLRAIRQTVDGYPGVTHDLVSYPQERLRQVRTGTADPVVVRLFGKDLGVLRAKADELRLALAGVPGVVAPHVSAEATEPTIEIRVDLAAADRHGIRPGDVRRAAATLLSSITVGNLFRDQKVFDVVVTGTPATRHSLSSVQNLMVDTPDGRLVRLGDVASVRVRPDPAVIRHADVSRYVDVAAGVRGRPLGAVTRDVERRVAAVRMPLEYHAQVLGAAVARDGARQRALGAACAVAVLALLLLQALFASWRLAALVVVTLPLALVGGALAAVAFAGQPITSLGSLAGFLAVLAVALRNGVLLVGGYQRLERDGAERGPELAVQGAAERLGPVVQTLLATGVLLAPLLAVGDLPGLELVRPLAVVVLGGLLSAAPVGLLLLPLLYLRFAPLPRAATSGAAMRLDPASE